MKKSEEFLGIRTVIQPECDAFYLPQTTAIAAQNNLHPSEWMGYVHSVEVFADLGRTLYKQKPTLQLLIKEFPHLADRVTMCHLKYEVPKRLQSHAIRLFPLSTQTIKPNDAFGPAVWQIDKHLEVPAPLFEALPAERLVFVAYVRKDLAPKKRRLCLDVVYTATENLTKRLQPAISHGTLKRGHDGKLRIVSTGMISFPIDRTMTEEVAALLNPEAGSLLGLNIKPESGGRRSKIKRHFKRSSQVEIKIITGNTGTTVVGNDNYVSSGGQGNAQTFRTEIPSHAQLATALAEFKKAVVSSDAKGSEVADCLDLASSIENASQQRDKPDMMERIQTRFQQVAKLTETGGKIAVAAQVLLRTIGVPI